ncbi:AAA domain-containing protein [Limnohabitans sp. DCL3]|uniref:AAA domain-containing protein n=1 Tax=Limnohabitans sp. DCL3 TaxID=3374103 RepID=UPI003A891896
MRAKPYEGLDRALWELIGKVSGAPELLKVAPRQYTRPISANLRLVIASQIEQIQDAALFRVVEALHQRITETLVKGAADAEVWIDEVQTFACEQVGERIVRPLVQKLDEPLRRSSYDVIDSLYSAEADMVRGVAQPLLTVLPQLLARHLAQPDAQALKEALRVELVLERVRQMLSEFFDGFVTADAFLELRDIETYASINEGFQLYLYIGAIKLRNAQYPLFFVPLDIVKLDGGRGYECKVVNPLFANRQAVEFVLQEIAQAKGREWVNPITERILYLTPQQSIVEVARGLYSAVAAALGLAEQTALSAQASEAKAPDVSLSPALHLCAYERGEESLVNDYEEIIAMARQGGSEIVDLFEKLVGGVLSSNPVSIASQVEQAWDGLPLVDRMVFDSPIALNEEQRKILLAVRNPEGPIVVVEGPPGTGKSHTITAIAADCAFNQRSCLILSDKAEALQVVQDKLSQAMSRVRHQQDFPNPLLRLGRQDANFKRLVANQTVSQISAWAKATQKNLPQLVAERDGTSTGLKGAIDTTVQTLGAVQLADVQRMHQQEARLREVLPEAMQAIERMAHDEEASILMALLQSFRQRRSAEPALGLELDAYLTLLQAEMEQAQEPLSLAGLRQRARLDEALARAVQALGAPRVALTGAFTSLSLAQAQAIQGHVLRYRQLKMPILGYLLRGAAVRELEAAINALSLKEPMLLRDKAQLLSDIAKSAIELEQALAAAGFAERLAQLWPRLSQASERAGAAGELLLVLQLLEQVAGLPEALATQAGRKASTWRLTLDTLVSWMKVREAFARAPVYDYVGTKSKLERLNTTLMNAQVDTRLVDFVNTQRNDARTMAQLIADRQKFPEDKFDGVRSSFPIILAGIREFGEFMPLVPGLFDVVVIDEASQVSVAQALPALLRAKKIVCLGDSKQFSNVKSSNASIALNDKYRANLVQFFERNVTREAQALKRLAMFDIKRSVLEFCSIAASYSVMLRKHFRSYPELISYSSTNFYGRQLQALKLRAQPIDEVIRFEQVDASGFACTRATNEAEVQAILARLLEMLELEQPPTVGVITPFREQHTLLQKLLLNHTRGREFEERLRLKIMTFDSCQGEERSTIFYSLVATPGQDALNYIFPVSLENAEEAVEEKLKVQRLNVGFSRAQDRIWIMHSQDIGLYKGALAQALHHYQRVLERKTPTVSDTDSNSPMEAKVLQWLQQSEFVQGQPDEVEIIPQFPIGDYLRQLDPTYEHPAWRVDFLLVCRTYKGTLHIVIEYDGFEFHFDKDKAGSVNVGNHERYLKDSDVERQLTLESYGYRFLRINRFNLGTDPVATLDERLAKLVELATGEQGSQLLDRLRAQAKGIAAKEMKECSRCKNIRPLKGFFDPALKGGEGGYGRVCLVCKGSGK